MGENIYVYYLYIVKCKDGTLYTGWTKDIPKRIRQHNAGTGAKYTRGRGPIRLMYSEKFTTKGEAMRREYEVKRMSRTVKLQLVHKTG